MPITNFSYTLNLDPAKDGTWSEDATSKLYEASIARGRANALTPMMPGEMTVLLNNRDGRYSPDKGVITDLDNFTPIRLFVTWSSVGAANRDDNPSAETDAVGAVGISASVPIKDTTDSWVGAASFKTTTTNVSGSGIEKKLRSGSRFSVSAGSNFRWEPRVKGPSGKALKIQILWFDSVPVNFQTDEVGFTLDGGWVQPKIAITAPVGAVTAALRVVTDGAQGIFDLFLDASFFYLSSNLIPYIDGDQPICTWTGTAHESTSNRSNSPMVARRLLYQGFVVDFDLREDKLNQVAVLTCIDRMGLWPGIDISVGNLMKKGSNLVLHRLMDRIEGELIKNWGIEQSLTTGDTDGYSILNGATIAEAGAGVPGSEQATFEGDFALRTTPAGAQAESGWRYDATTDIAVTGNYRLATYARSNSGTVAVRFRFLRDAVVIVTKTVTLTTSWQRIKMDGNLTTLGTNRYVEMVTDIADATIFLHDDLHVILKPEAIGRDFDVGATTFEVVNAYHEPASAVVGDVLESEPGFMFVKAGPLTDGDDLAFRDLNSRPTSAIPRAVLGDGDGLMQFTNLAYLLAGAGRVSRVIVTSRGTAKSASSKIGVWELAPKRDTTTGDKWRARYRQPVRLAVVTEKAGVVIDKKNQNFGAGHDIEVTTGAVESWLFIEGVPYEYPTEESSVTKEAVTGLPIKNELLVAMPLQDTDSAGMSTEAQRLLDKYKNRVIRLNLELKQRTDEVQGFQIDVEINDLVIVRAKFESHSPGFDKQFWVEGIKHDFDGRSKVLRTMLSLEEI